MAVGADRDDVPKGKKHGLLAFPHCSRAAERQTICRKKDLSGLLSSEVAVQENWFLLAQSKAHIIVPGPGAEQEGPK